MKHIYSASHLPEAYLVRDLLMHAGIAAHIFNENTMGAVGDLPMGAASPQIWIQQPHQEQHARAIIAHYERKTTDGSEAANKFCAQCQEANPAGFELCWNCSAVLPDTA